MLERTLTPWRQLALLLVLMVLGLVLGALVNALVWAQLTGLPVNAMKTTAALEKHSGLVMFINSLTSIIAFVMPAWVVATFSYKQPLTGLGFSPVLSGKQVFIIILLMTVGLMLSGALGELNKAIPLPAQWRSAADGLEKMYGEQISAMLKLNNAGQFALSLLVLALLPALCEELLFRGAMQPAFIRVFQNPMVGILVSSVLFSLLHTSWYGFLPRTVLGMVLGCIFYYSGNLWLSILAHFLNNALVLTIIYSMHRGAKLSAEVLNENPVQGNPYLLAVLGLVAVVLLLRSFRQESLMLFLRTDRDPDHRR